MSIPALRAASVAGALLVTTPAMWAHSGDHGADLVAGLAHPVLGWDHVLAALAVALMALHPATTGLARWLIPLTFLVGLVLGGLGAVMVGSHPGVWPSLEIALALTVLLGGALVAWAIPMKTWLACAAAGIFALFHGFAHLSEIGSASATSFFPGLLLSSGLMLAIAVGLGHFLMTLARPNGFQHAAQDKASRGKTGLRLAGLLIALAGAGMCVF